MSAVPSVAAVFRVVQCAFIVIACVVHTAAVVAMEIAAVVVAMEIDAFVVAMDIVDIAAAAEAAAVVILQEQLVPLLQVLLKKRLL